MFEYETQKYSPTVYKKNNTEENKTSDALSVNNKLHEDSKQVAVSDAIKINFQSKSDENLGLVNNNTFNMSLKGEIVKLEILNNNDKKSIETKEIKETVNKFKISPFENKEANVDIYYKLKVNNKLQEDSKQVAVSDAIKINFQSKSDENLGLVNNNTFNMSLKGEIVKLEILNNNDKKSIETKEIKETVNKFKISPFENKEANVDIYYKLKVKNEGNIPGKVVKIGAYLSENENIVDGQRWIKERENFATTRQLENTELNPGEEKEIEVKIQTTIEKALNKVMDTKFEIIETSNNIGIKDVNSVEGNNSTNEDDNINLDIVIVRDFTVIYITILAAIAAVGLAFRNKIIQIFKKFKKERNTENTKDKGMDETLRKEVVDDKQE